MKDEFRILIKEIGENVTNGDIEIGRMIVYFFLDHFSSLIEDDVKEIGMELSKSKTEMATIQNIAQLLIELYNSPKILYQRLIEFKGKMGINYISDIINRFINSIDNPIRIITISRSSTVKSALLKLSENKLVRNLYIIRSYPGLEGLGLHKELIEAGVNNTSIYLSEIPRYIPEIDMALCGADAITDEYIVNKLGTYLLFEYATFYRKKTVVVGNPLKRTVRDIKINNRIFEKIPIKYVSTIYE